MANGKARVVLPVVGLVGLFVFYAASFAGIRQANQGSHYALIRSLADGRVSIDRYAAYTGGVDLAKRDGHEYSNKAPGTAGLALPLYLAGRAVAGSPADDRAPAPSLTRDRSAANLRVPPVEEFATGLLPALAGVAIVVLSFTFARTLGAAAGPSWGIAFAIGLATMVWRYSTQLFAHAPATAFLMAGMVLAVKLFEGAGRRAAILLGLVLAAAVAVDYPMALPAAAIAVLVLASRGRRAFGDAAAIAAGAAVPVALLLLYQWQAFGSPFTPSYRFDVHPYAHSFGSAYSEPLSNIGALLFDTRRGLVPWNPLLLLAPLGVGSLWRVNRRAAFLVLAAAVPLLLLQATYREWFGGGTQDSRFVLAVIPILIAPLAVFLSRLRRKGSVAAWIATTGALAGAGAVLQGGRLVFTDRHRSTFVGMRRFVDRNLIDVGRWLRAVAAAMFPSVRYAPVALAVALLIAVLCAGVLRVRRRAEERRTLERELRQPEAI